MMPELRGKNVLVLGLGVNQGGSGIARYLVDQGARVVVTDMLSEEELIVPLKSLEGLPIRFVLGGHDESDIRWADIVVRNPGVPRESRWLSMAREAGVQVEMEMTLFFRACKSPIIGVTGTKGKTTVSTNTATLLRQHWSDARLVGNMGRSAVLELGNLRDDVPVVVELSSFQIEGLADQQRSPHIAVLTNIAEDHLDRYASYEEYSRTKASLAAFQADRDWLVYNRDDELLSRLLAEMPARRVTVGRSDSGEDHSFWLNGDEFLGRWDGQTVQVGEVGSLQSPGEHSRMNALIAVAAAMAAGAPIKAIRDGLREIRPIPDRMEPVATVGGVEYVNDTTATVPVAAVAALQAFEGRPLIVIAGGSEKHISLDLFARELTHRTTAVILLDGSATGGLHQLLVKYGCRSVLGPFDSMQGAVEQAVALAEEGSVVLLSPGCASFGMFRNEFDRGRQFREAVREIQSAALGKVE